MFLHLLVRRTCAVLLVALVVMSQADPSAAQNTGRIEGSVVLESTGNPVPGVQVFIERLSVGGVTDSNGRFELERVPAGDHVLNAHFVGYRRQSHTVSVRAGETVSVDFELREEAIRLEDVVVSGIGERQDRSEVPATISSLDREALERIRPSHPSDVMNQIAGVWVNHTSGEGHMTAIRQPLTTEPVYLYLENGVPTRSTGFFNHNALYEVNLPMAEGVEVIKGPGSALYGSDAIGAVINVATRQPSIDPTADVSLEGGAFGFGRVMLGGGTSYGRHGLRLDINGTKNDGWRDASGYDRQSGTLTWDVHLPGASRLTTVASLSHIDQKPAGASSLNHDDFRIRPTVNYTPISFRSVDAIRLSTSFERWTLRSFVSLTPFFRYNDMHMLPNWSLTYDPSEWQTQNYSVGLLTRYRYDFGLMNTRIVGGIDLEYSPGSHLEQAIDPQRDGRVFTSYTSIGTIYDYDVTFRQASPYIHVETAPISALRLTGGLRLDALAYDYDNHLSVANDGPHRRAAGTSRSFFHASPKFGATYRLASFLNLFASYAHAFRVPSENQLFRQGPTNNTLDLEPVRADNLEVGLRSDFGALFTVELSAYRMIKADDIVSFTDADGAQVSTNAGRTSHRGIELGATAEPASGITLSGNVSRALHRYERWQPSADQDFGGNEMDVAPRTIVNMVATYEPAFFRAGSISVEWSRLGEYWMDPANTVTYDGYDLINVRAEYNLPAGFSVFGRLMNLTDEHYADRATYNDFRGEELSPGLPRALYIGLEYRVRAEQ